MWWKSTTEYVSLETSNEDMKSDNEMHTRLPRSRQIFRIIAPWCIHAALLSISSTFYFQASSLNGLTKSLTGPPVAHEYGGFENTIWYHSTFIASTWHLPLLTGFYLIGPAVDAVGARYPQTSSVGFLDRSVYRGSPSPELDAAWDHITQGMACIQIASTMRTYMNNVLRRRIGGASCGHDKNGEACPKLGVLNGRERGIIRRSRGSFTSASLSKPCTSNDILRLLHEERTWELRQAGYAKPCWYFTPLISWNETK